MGRRGAVIAVASALAAVLALGLALAAVQGAQVMRSWAPQPRQLGGLRAVAAAGPGGFSLYTARGPVHFLPGVDLGASTPGHFSGDFAISAGTYRRWLAEMGWFGVRAVRIYTVHPPAFYTALAAYDRAHPARPIYLIQGVYPPVDTPPGGDYYAPGVVRPFQQALREAAAAVHGTLMLPPGPGHPSGRWTADVSRWTAGWIIGLEWDPAAVVATDRRNAAAPAARGRYFASTPGATPMERWLAARLNDAATAVAATGWTIPIAFVNWPALDPLHHPDEPSSLTDLAGVDASHVLPTPRWPGGTFAAFDSYPNYPAFLRYQPDLQRFRFAGRYDPYAGYLHALQAHFRGRMPVVVAEFGVASSLGVSRAGPLGRDAGGLTEQRAMRIDGQLLRELHSLGLGGALMFEWADEWFMHSWNTMRHQLPADRTPYWHDAFTSAQFAGLVATDALGTGPGPAVIYRQPPRPGIRRPGGPVREVSAWTDESCLHLTLLLRRPPPGALTIGLDTIRGLTGPPPPGSGDRHAGFALMLDLTRHTGQAWVRDQLDPVRTDAPALPAGTRPPARDGWRPLELLLDPPGLAPLTRQRIPARFSDAGLLRYGSWNPQRPGYDSLALWNLGGGVLRLRIPWAMAGLSDPSSHHALIPGRGSAHAVTIGGIGITTAAGGITQQAGTADWRGWDSVRYRERIKAGAGAVRSAFAAAGAGP